MFLLTQLDQTPGPEWDHHHLPSPLLVEVTWLQSIAPCSSVTSITSPVTVDEAKVWEAQRGDWQRTLLLDGSSK